MKFNAVLAMAAVLAVGLAASSQVGDPAKAEKGRDYEALAQKLVTQVTQVKEGDRVMISGAVRDAELLENLAVQVRKQGAFPLVTLASDRMRRRMFDDVPPKFDAQKQDFELKLAEIVTAQIDIDASESDDALAGVPADRLAAVGKGNMEVHNAMLKRNVRMVSVGNGIYPTEKRAKQFGITKEELAKAFWDGIDTDYAKMQAVGEAVQKALAKGKKVTVTNPNGTDITLGIEKREVFVSDGVLTAERIKKGGPACQVWLPAGEVYVAPTAGTAEGKVVVDRFFYEGKEIKGLTLTFKGGKMTAFTAKEGIERVKAVYDASNEGRDGFSFLDIGINPSVPAQPGTKLLSFMGAGMISVGVGNNTWAGGDNNSNFGIIGFIPGCTVIVDGETIVKDGKLMVK